MGCNWELYELRVLIFSRGTKIPLFGNFVGKTEWEFFNVMLDLPSLGIAGFQGSGLACNFQSVFSQLANMKKLPFGFTSEVFRQDKLNFGNLEAAFKTKTTLRSAKLYVHRRDTSDSITSATGPGVLLETVTIDYAARTPHFDVRLSGKSANTINF